MHELRRNRFLIYLFSSFYFGLSFFFFFASARSSSFYSISFMLLKRGKKRVITLTAARRRRLVIKCFNIVYLIARFPSIQNASSSPPCHPLTKLLSPSRYHRAARAARAPPALALSGSLNIASLCCYYIHNIMFASAEK